MQFYSCPLCTQSLARSFDDVRLLAKAMCGASGALKGFGQAGGDMQLRIGMGFGGNINEILFWKQAQPGVRSRMNRFKPIAALKSQLYSAYMFDDVDATNPSLIVDAAGNAPAGSLQNGAFRSILYGVNHKFKMCPGVTRFSSETVCSTRTYWEQGVCSRRPGVDNYACDCNDGFFGADCSGECPGGPGNICSNHGVCQVFNETVCVCQPGYLGDACQHECPGWTDPMNLPNQKICFGFGTCRLRADKKAAECLCDQSFDRYGPACQYTYGEKPVASIDEGCQDCRGAHKTCVDGSCLCEKGYYLVVGVCKGAASALSISLSALLVALLSSL